jgi:peptidoglycan/xylan/chitin deacetylase (PgdA/CDA1 family)
VNHTQDARATSVMKELIFRLLYLTQAVRLTAWLNRKRVAILCYHGVTERPTRRPEDAAGLHVRYDRFLAHLEYLRRGYRVISLRDYLTAREAGRELPPYSVVLTFDDGYRNFITAAAPALRRFEMPASVFLITDRVENDARSEANRTWSEADDEAYLSWADVKQLTGDGFEFGSHTCSHPKLPELSPDQIEHELGDARTAIANHLQLDVLSLAYPYGLTSSGIAEKAQTLGYSCALTTETGFNDHGTDLFMLRRTLIGDDDDVASFATRVSGLTRWLSSGSALVAGK